MRKRKPRLPRIDFELTDSDLTAFGSASALVQNARQFGLFEFLDNAVSVKVQNCGAIYHDTRRAIIASLAFDHGALTGLDALRAHTVASTLLDLGNLPEARRPKVA